MEEVKNVCGGCYHFGPCRKMMETVLDPQWHLEAAFMASRPACEDYIDEQLVTAALYAAAHKSIP